MVDGTRWASFNILETVGLLEFSYRTVFRVYDAILGPLLVKNMELGERGSIQRKNNNF